ncbi:DUF4192 domain-containing protein [Nocardioides sp. MAHUQ-72]|uniref:DUF4192 domain-containing protein n=1 Tax=unclassified Nocardioides TaxID=2615069 RepID=UPI003616D844
MTTPTTPTQPTTLVARSPEDVLAAVPVVLGFVPQRSIVMLTFGAVATFHARVDLPPPAHVDHAVDALLGPALRHEVRGVVFVLYTDDADQAQQVSRALVPAFEGSGIDVLESLRADGRRWFALLPGRPGVPVHGVPYDVSAHRFVAQSVLDGRVTLASRDELAASLARHPDRGAAVTRLTGDRTAGAAQPTAEAAWVRSTVGRQVAAGAVPSDEEAARLLRALRDLQLRDVAWSLMTRETSPQHVGYWTDLVRRSPDDLLPAPAALLGFAAWLAGHGALAWCAVERCQEVDPGYGLADIVGRLLHHAVPPSAWDFEAGWSDVFDDPA